MNKENVTAGTIARLTEAHLTGEPSTVITDISHDSRRVGAGALFAAVSGAVFDAHKFVPKVMSQGGAGVLSERSAPEGFPGVWLQVSNIRRAMALAAAEVQHHPSRELQLVGITGTNGKTTTAYLVASIPEEAGELAQRYRALGNHEYRLAVADADTVADQARLPVCLKLGMQLAFDDQHRAGLRHQPWGAAKQRDGVARRDHGRAAATDDEDTVRLEVEVSGTVPEVELVQLAAVGDGIADWPALLVEHPRIHREGDAGGVHLAHQF